MLSTLEPAAPVVAQDGSTVQGEAAYLTDIVPRLAPDFERAEPRQRVIASLRRRLSAAERKTSWPWATVSGDAPP
jgi:hypothetical protein